MKKAYRSRGACWRWLLLPVILLLTFAARAVEPNIDGNPEEWCCTEVITNPTYTHVADPFTGLDDQFTTGAADENFALKSWTYSQVKNKNNIANGAAVLIGTKLYFAGDRLTTEGDAQIGFWFFQDGTAPLGVGTPGDKGYFEPLPAIGDLLVLANFTNGGRQANVTVYSVSSYKYKSGNIIGWNFAEMTGTDAIAAQNNDMAYPVPTYWDYGSTMYPMNAFYEGYVDLADLGEDYELNVCFGSFMLETRSSASLTASLDDFVAGPFSTLPEITAEGDAACAELVGTTLLTLCASSDDPDLDYVWYSDEALTNVIGNTACIDVYVFETTTFWVVGINAIECTSVPAMAIAEVYPNPGCEISDYGNVTCFDYADGWATVSVTSGTPPFSYLWSDGQTTQTATGLSGGNYSVVVTDDNGCFTECNVTIYEPPLLECTITGYGDVDCYGNANGWATIAASGGTPPYDYLWSDGQTTATASGLSGGDYSVLVTDDNGCETTCYVSIYEPPLLVCEITGFGDVTCFDDADGWATVAASGGTQPYDYLWSDGQTTATASGLSGGDYSVLVTDDNGCETTCYVTIYEPPLLECEITGYGDVDCYGNANGWATVAASGGTPPYGYLWSDGQTTATASGLSGGDYSVLVTDDNGCETTCYVTIYEPPLLVCEITGYGDVTCFDDADGWATVGVTGGTPPYSYLWSDGQTSATATGLSGGDYSVLVTDDNGCETTCYVTIYEPPLLECEITGYGDVDCFGDADGWATVAASGGTPPYGYLWSDGQTTATASGLSGGDYSVLVTDDNGCETTCYVSIYEPPLLYCEAVEMNPATCYLDDGSATVYAYGGTPPYDYLWSDGQTTQTAVNLAPGWYSVTVTDDNGCTTDCAVEITWIPCGCETAYAKGDPSICFIDGGYASNWGWTNPILPGTYEWPLWADAGGCNLDAATLVGSATVVYGTDGVVSVVITMAEGYTLDDQHIYAGYLPYPGSGIGNWMNEGPFNGGQIYVIVHGVVCGDFSKTIQSSTDAKVTLNVSPNPFRDEASIRVTSSENTPISVEIYNLTGIRVATLYEGSAQAYEIYTFRFSTPEPQQLFMVVVRTPSGVTSTKMLKVR